MKKITMADYYNTQAVLQQNKALKEPYECNLFEHEYDDLLSEFTLDEFIDATNEIVNSKGHIEYEDGDNCPPLKAVFDMDTPCRAVFYRVINGEA